jgi:hypothetical protein
VHFCVACPSPKLEISRRGIRSFSMDGQLQIFEPQACARFLWRVPAAFMRTLRSSAQQGVSRRRVVLLGVFVVLSLILINYCPSCFRRRPDAAVLRFNLTRSGSTAPPLQPLAHFLDFGSASSVAHLPWGVADGAGTLGASPPGAHAALPITGFSSTTLRAAAAALGRSGEEAASASGQQPLLLIYGDQDGWREYVSSEFMALFRMLRKAYGWRVTPRLPEAATWPELWTGMARQWGGRPPDVVIFVEDYASITRLGPRNASRDGGSSGGPRAWLFSDDVHYFSEEQHATLDAALHAVDLLLCTYEEPFRRLHPEHSRLRVFSVPHAASPLFALPINPTPREAVLLAGATGLPWYPYRALVQERIAAGDARFALLAHPGYALRHDPAAPEGSVGVGFARLLNGHLAVITDGLKLNYMVAKMFEIPATGALLLVNEEMAASLERYAGMLPFVHYVPYTAATLDAVVDAVLDPANRPYVDRVRAQGQELVWARHTTSDRAAAIDALARVVV